MSGLAVSLALAFEERSLRCLLVSTGGRIAKLNLATCSSGPNVRESAHTRIGPEQVATASQIMNRTSAGRVSNEGG